MGLDMYLHKRHSFWDFRGDKVLYIDAPQHRSIRPDKITCLDEKVMVWRKANQIHRWFVENIQDGDDCHDYECSPEQLKELLSLCEQVLADHSLAESLLPVQEGFFFGSTDYDEHYFQDVQETADMLRSELSQERLLDEPHVYFVYSSSW
jgi:hypothetical protein